MEMQTNKGFTLIEFMIAIVVLSLLVTIAVPSYTFVINENRMASQVNDFVANLQYARSEAIKRGLPVSVCQSGTQPNCDSPAGGWEQGWIVVVNDGPGGTSQTILKDFAALTLNGNDTLTGNGTVTDTITFDRNGFALGSVGTVRLCDQDNTAIHTRAVVIAASGRVTQAEDTDDDGTVDVNGVNISCP